VRCCESLLASYSPTKATIVALPLATRFAGPREALWHAIIQKNYGCTHFMVGSDHASPANRPDAKPFYLPNAAQELVDDYSDELGIAAVRARTFVYLRQQNRYVPEHEASSTDDVCHLSAAELGQRLADGHDLPEWFTFPSVARELRRAHPPRTEQGFTVFFTGLSGSGKSTVAKRLYVRLMELGGRPVTLLDGDIVRKHLSSELGFSREHRDINITRIGFVASEITKNGGIALCAPIAPFDSVRKTVRQMVSAGGGFILVHIATPLEICERRDPKGLYAKARAGLLQQFTGVSDAYESPDDAEVVIDTTRSRPQQAVDAIIEHLRKQKYLPMPASATVTEENPKIEAPF
jgi:sulfate adenylyltransferase